MKSHSKCYSIVKLSSHLKGLNSHLLILEIENLIEAQLKEESEEWKEGEYLCLHYL